MGWDWGGTSRNGIEFHKCTQEWSNRGSAHSFWQLWEVNKLSGKVEEEGGEEEEEVAMTTGRRARG